MQQKLEFFKNRLLKVYKHLAKWARRQELECFRFYDHDLPEFPFCIEQYGTKLYVAEYRRKHGMSETEHDAWLSDCVQIMSEVTEISVENIHLKERQRIVGRRQQYQKLDEQKSYFEVTENGHRFLINLTDYLDTGLFLDHRITRKMVQEKSSGKKVLNLFCYTGSFSVYAAAGGASEVWSIDMSNTYMEWTAQNMQLNGFKDSKKYIYKRDDVLQGANFLPKDYFNIIILDPPTYSNSKKMQGDFDVQRDHVKLINTLQKCMRAGGEMYFSTNYTRFELYGERLQFSSIKDITKATVPLDFEGKLKRDCFLLVK